MARVHHVLVDSRDRDKAAYPAPGAYRVRLPKRYKHVVSARLLSVVLPASFFQFSVPNGNVAMDVTVGTTTAVVSINDGNYAADSLAAEVLRALRAAFPGNSFALAVSDDRVATLTCDAAVTIGKSKLATALGFAGGAGPSTALTGAGAVDPTPVPYVLLDIDELNGVDEGGLDGGEIGRGYFASLQIPGPANSVVFRDVDVAPPAVEQRPPVEKLDALTVLFRTHDGAPIDFRGAEHSFVLELATGASPTPPVLPALPVAVPARASQASQASPLPAKAAPQMPAPTAPPPARRWTKFAMAGVALVSVVMAMMAMYVYRRR